MGNLDHIGLASGDAAFVDKWNQGCRAAHNEELQWITMLKADGVKASHPEDGWVDREKNEVFFCYPQFGGDDNVSFGDRVALGRPGKYRIVEIIGSRRVILGDMKYWKFK